MKQKNSKSILVITICIMVIVVLTCVIIFSKSKKQDVVDYKYLIEYRDSLTPGNKYLIYISEDYNIVVQKGHFCSTTECIKEDKNSSSEKYEVKISNNNKNKLEKFIKLLFVNNGNEIVLSDDEISQNNKNVINAIVFNNEIFFDYYNNDFEIVTDSRSCISIIQDIYVDGEYLCSLPCPKDYKIRLNDGSEYSLSDILNNHIYTVDELNDKGLNCNKK